MGKKTLHNKEWEEIHQLLIDDDLSIQDIADEYKVMRSTIYNKAWAMGWIQKKSEKEKEKVGMIHKLEKFWKK